MSQRYLTSNVLPIDCVYKRDPEDFVVEEVPAFSPCGEGQHLWMWMEKRGKTTDQALGVLATALGCSRRKLRVGGKKDAQAVTVQWVSLDLPPKDYEARLADMDTGGAGRDDYVRVLETKLHRTAHGLGRTHGNRFRIRLRDVATDRVEGLRQVMATLEERGVPNFFGQQRFGFRGDTDLVGEALLRERDVEAVSRICGRAGDLDTGRRMDARVAFDTGDFLASLEAWPRSDFAPHQLLKSLVRQGVGLTDASAKIAVESLDRRDVAFYMSAFQSRLFNQVLERRIEHFDELWLGDLALRLPGARKAFLVEDLAVEQPRAAAGEITASGPLFGPEMPTCEGRAAQIEEEVLVANGWSQGDLQAPRFRLSPGGRRPLRIPLMNLEVSHTTNGSEATVELAFQLPKGCFATAVLAEIQKPTG
ncbi:MAG: tRNA pseudouridine13 synthase [Planctomycetota bacterium]|jgi:tRNA pseudouridine13 synthase